MRTFTVLVVIALAASAIPALAQTAPGPRPERPFRGLFAGGTGNATQLLTVSASFGGGYDDDIFLNQQAGVAPVPGSHGSTSFLNASGDLGYSVSKKRVSFSASLGSGVGHYPGLNQPSLVHHSAGAGGSFQIGRHSTVSIHQSETYQPFYFWSAMPMSVTAVDPIPVFDPGTMTIADAVQAASLNLQQPIAADATVGSNAEYYLASETGVGFTQGLTRNLSLDLSYGYRRSDSKSGAQDFSMQSGGGRLGYILGKGLGLHAGYGYSQSVYQLTVGESRYQGHNIDVGVDYSKALSISRRTTFGFTTGTSGFNDGTTTHYNLVGTAHLTHEMGRTWSAGLAYQRYVAYTETFRAPALTDDFTGSVGGLLSRKTQVQGGVGISRGDVGFTPANNYSSAFASGGARFAINRYSGVSVSYSYYHYLFADDIALAPGLLRHTNRQSISVSIDFWAPLIQHNRSGR